MSARAEGPLRHTGRDEGALRSIGRRPARELTNSIAQRPEGAPRDADGSLDGPSRNNPPTGSKTNDRTAQRANEGKHQRGNEPSKQRLTRRRPRQGRQPGLANPAHSPNSAPPHPGPTPDPGAPPPDSGNPGPRATPETQDPETYRRGPFFPFF